MHNEQFRFEDDHGQNDGNIYKLHSNGNIVSECLITKYMMCLTSLIVLMNIFQATTIITNNILSSLKARGLGREIRSNYGKSEHLVILP